MSRQNSFDPFKAVLIYDRYQVLCFCFWQNNEVPPSHSPCFVSHSFCAWEILTQVCTAIGSVLSENQGRLCLFTWTRLSCWAKWNPSPTGSQCVLSRRAAWRARGPRSLVQVAEESCPLFKRNYYIFILWKIESCLYWLYLPHLKGSWLVFLSFSRWKQVTSSPMWLESLRLSQSKWPNRRHHTHAGEQQ